MAESIETKEIKEVSSSAEQISNQKAQSKKTKGASVIEKSKTFKEKKAQKAEVKKKSKKSETGKNEDIITYDEVFGDETTVEYQATFEGVKENIVLETNTGADKFTFNIDAGNLEALEENGAIYFIDPLTGETKAEIAPVYTYDSKLDENGNAAPNSSTEGGYEIYKNEDGTYKVVLNADTEFLNDENTVYPVYIDPTVTIEDNTNIIDGIYYSGYETIYKNWTEGILGNSNSEYGVGRLLVAFPNLKNNETFKSISTSGCISKATYSMYLYGDTTATGVKPFMYKESWTNVSTGCGVSSTPGWDNYDAVTDNSSTGISAMDGISIGKSATAKKYDFNVTSAVRLWKNEKYNPAYGLMFQNGVESNSSYCKNVYMREKGGDLAPYLKIDYKQVLTLSQSKCQLSWGDSFTLSGTINPSSDIVFTSSDASVAKITSSSSKSCVIKGLQAGTATITAKSSVDGNVKATCTVTVNLHPDPLHYSNIVSCKITKINDPDGDIILVTVKTRYESVSYFTATDGTNKITYMISPSLISQLQNDEQTYQYQLVKGTMEKCFHLGKEDADKLVKDGVISNGSTEYYGVWCHNGNYYYNYGRKLDEYIAVLSVSLCLNYIVTNNKANEMSYGSNTLSSSSYSSEVKSIENSIINKAKAAQTKGGYNSDAFELTVLKKGTKVYGLRGTEPNIGQSAWYTTKEMVEKSGYDTVTLNQGLQVYKDTNYGYRSNIGVYELKEDLLAPMGKALNNTAYGAGGYTQFYIEDFSSVLKYISQTPLN